jgi:proteasome accessory factor A
MDQGSFQLPLPREEIAHHSLCPPPSTRAAVRGRCIEKFGAAVEATQWDYVSLQSSRGTVQLDLRSLFDPDAVRQSLKIIGAARTVEDLLQLPFAKLG